MNEMRKSPLGNSKNCYTYDLPMNAKINEQNFKKDQGTVSSHLTSLIGFWKP